MVSTIKQYGIGIQYNPEISDWFPFERQDVDVLEVLVDTVMGPLDSPYCFRPGGRELLDHLASKFQLIAHSNYGCEFGFLPLKDTPAVKRHVPIARYMKSPWIADHCFYGDNSWVDVWSSPVQFSFQEVKRIGARAKELQQLYGMPLAHENAAYYVSCPGSEMREAEFLAALVEEAETYLHLDLHNIYTNSLNHASYDLHGFLNTIPLQRVVELHLSGGSWDDGLYHDWHDAKVPEPVWDLLENVLERCRPGAAILEFQGRAHHPNTRVMCIEEDLAMIEAQITRAKTIWDRVYGPGSRTSHSRSDSLEAV